MVKPPPSELAPGRVREPTPAFVMTKPIPLSEIPPGSTTALEVVRVKAPVSAKGKDKVRVPLLMASPRVEFADNVVAFGMVRGVVPTDETPPPLRVKGP